MKYPHLFSPIRINGMMLKNRIGGPAGMKAAVTASDRGHRVILVEKSDRLGGQLLLNEKIPGREEILLAAGDLENNLKARPVEIPLGKEAEETLIREGFLTGVAI